MYGKNEQIALLVPACVARRTYLDNEPNVTYRKTVQLPSLDAGKNPKITICPQRSTFQFNATSITAIPLFRQSTLCSTISATTIDTPRAMNVLGMICSR